MSRPRAGVSAAIAALVGAAVIVLAFAPGYMSADSVDQLSQARTGVYFWKDPPVMAWVWARIDRIVPGPIGMLVLQNALFFGGLALLAAQCLPASIAWLAVLVIGLSPPVASLLTTIWKDTQMGAALVLLTALLFRAERKASGILLAAIAGLLFYADAVRYNALLAVVPLGVRAGMLAGGRIRRTPLRFVVGLAFMGVVHLAAVVSNSLLAPLPKGILQGVYLHDLVGISLATGRDLLPDYVHQGPGALSAAKLAPRYRVDKMDFLFYSDGPNLWVTENPAELRALRRAWRKAVLANPAQWFEQRWTLFSRLLGLSGPPLYPYHFQVDPNPLGVRFEPSELNRVFMGMFESTRYSLLFRVWIYLTVPLVVLAIPAVRRQSALAFSMALSATIYIPPYFLVGPSTDFRYAWWSVLVALLLPIVLIGERRRKAMVATDASALEPSLAKPPIAEGAR